MKFILILTICTSYLLLNCEGLKCYETDAVGYKPSNVTTKECKPPFRDFCVTMTIENGVDEYISCGEEEFCEMRACYSGRYCDEPGTFVRAHPRIRNATFTIACCDTDLCNVKVEKVEEQVSSSSSNYIGSTGFRLLFCMSLFFITSL